MFRVVVDGCVISTTSSRECAESTALMWREAKHLAWVEWVNPVTGKAIECELSEQHRNDSDNSG